MQVIVLGAGAIGSLFGAKLATGGNDVTLVGRPDHVRAINQDGLRIEGLEARTIRIRAAMQVEQIGPDALILLTTKVPSTRAALEPIARVLRDDTTILCLQNGLHSEEIARGVLGDSSVVLRGITQAGAIFERAGVIRYMVAGHTLIQQHARSSVIADVFNVAGIECRISREIATEVWRKVIYNCVVNPITAILGSDVGRIVDPALDPLKRLVIDECIAVARTEGLVFQSDLLLEINRAYAGSRNIVSMRQDLLRGRPTEIDYLNGAVVSLGEKHGIACSVNRALTAIIKAMEAPSQT
jgi:2-dehydropantoate 2-reductase